MTYKLKKFVNVRPFESVQTSSKLPDYVDLDGSNTTSKFVPFTL